ncbi:hypothetical protein H0N96_01025 [Candidatus Micrarchaeota archaeon]|nr:hypothetical protein [Candidatus Micrarchaeota archaeon]
MNKKSGRNCFYENYPAWIVLASNLVSLLIYAAGAFVLYQVGIVWVALYVIYILLLEMRLVRNHCVDCYYYGKVCAFGQGKLSALLFKKGIAKNFAGKKVTWIDLAPDFLVSLIPLVAGILLLIKSFNWLVAGMLALILILSFAGNAFVRGQLACKHCKQREFGCPAEKLFSKK